MWQQKYKQTKNNNNNWINVQYRIGKYESASSKEGSEEKQYIKNGKIARGIHFSSYSPDNGACTVDTLKVNARVKDFHAN